MDEEPAVDGLFIDAVVVVVVVIAVVATAAAIALVCSRIEGEVGLAV